MLRLLIAQCEAWSLPSSSLQSGGERWSLRQLSDTRKAEEMKLRAVLGNLYVVDPLYRRNQLYMCSLLSVRWEFYPVLQMRNLKWLSCIFKALEFVRFRLHQAGRHQNPGFFQETQF